MTFEIERHEVPAQLVLSIRDRVPSTELPAFLGRSFGELFGHVRVLSIEVTGEPFVIYHAYGPDALDAEVCLPVAGEVAASGRISTRELPETTVAVLTFVGPYERLGEAYRALDAWAVDHAFRAAGPVRERYVAGPGSGVGPADYRTIVEMPIEPVAVLVGA
jgi:effector-binding domain-containing protein